ncbi:DUF4381 domain-containing protein [Salinibius halmophilus]|uniref:DUF4381 domain-containing protein n=1 Tax=Salinibius halmophilus TaxID=1853216 RepID=UPI000E66CAE0|nr:DUF4381 domain-containing protein [Salinibius halmophilus]
MLPHDVVSLAPPPVWPLAIGWWLVIALTVPCLVLIVWWLIRLRLRNKAVRQLYKQWRLQAKRQPTPDFATIKQMSESLKRLLINRHGRDEVAQLAGKAWLNYLDNLIGQTLLSTEAERWQRLFYDGHDAQSCQTLQRALIAWLKVYKKRGGRR